MDPIERRTMDEDQRARWERLCAHRFEAPEQGLDFTRRLAREQGWTLPQARAAVDEYRKFCFLACCGNGEMTPSREVDEVWHLHLIHTRDYWREFGPKVLGMELHHGPTRGGADEARRHREQYAHTLAIYEQWFGPPPQAWWPGTAARFASPARPSRARRGGPRGWLALASLGLASLCLARLAQAQSINPLDWTGGEFLKFYLVAMLCTLVASVLIRRAARDTGAARGARPEALELAYLAGGATRCADAGIAQMLAEGQVEWDTAASKLRSTGGARRLGEPYEQIAQCIAADGAPDRAVSRAALRLDSVRKALIAKGLWLDEAGAWRARWWSALPWLLLGGFGAAKIGVGISRGKPVAFLVILSIITVVVGLILLLKRPGRTRAGDRALAEARVQHARAIRAPRAQETGLAVALLGTAALSGTAWASYHQSRVPPSSSSSDSGSSGSDSGSSDSGGDSGGGGCGGCGGGGGD